MYDFEKQLENDFIKALTSDDYNIRKWRDASLEKTYPVVLIHISDVRPAPEGWQIHSALIEISARTYITDDKQRTVIYELIRKLRSKIYNKSTFKNNLNQSSQYKYIDYDIDSGQYEAGYDTENIISLTLTVYFQIGSA